MVTDLVVKITNIHAIEEMGSSAIVSYKTHELCLLRFVPSASQGHPADAVFYIQKGKVKLTVVSNNGKEATIDILSDRYFFGEGCLAGQPLRMSAATAMTDCDLLLRRSR
jgi:CRP-like cAMP-binding protein